MRENEGVGGLLSVRGYFLVPRWLGDRMAQMTSEYCLLLLRLYYCLWILDNPPYGPTTQELADGAGLSFERAERCLNALEIEGCLRKQNGKWGLTEGAANCSPKPPALPH